jgi:Flp pilus assembly protein TadG
VSAVECAVVYPVTMLLLMGSLILGMGVFRYQQLQSLAREGARYASVCGANYAAANGSVATTSTVLSHVQAMAVGLSGLNCTGVSYTSTTQLPATVTVTLTYTWTPEGFYQPVTWTATSTEIVTY